MPFSEIKIDGSFVMQMQSNAGCRVIVEIVIDLARKLGLASVAEGVEEEAALHSLKEMGCDAAQGFHLCRPLCAVRVADFVREYGRGSGEALPRLNFRRFTGHRREGGIQGTRQRICPGFPPSRSPSRNDIS